MGKSDALRRMLLETEELLARTDDFLSDSDDPEERWLASLATSYRMAASAVIGGLHLTLDQGAALAAFRLREIAQARMGLEDQLARLQAEEMSLRRALPPETEWALSLPELERVRCRFGCEDPVVGIYHVPEGAHHPDPVQALCAQHFVKADPSGPMAAIVHRPLERRS